MIRNRALVYALVNIGVVLASVFGMMAGNASAGAATYACLLLMLCTLPLLWLERLNDRYALLAAFTGSYYLLFGALSLRNVLLGSDLPVEPEMGAGFMTAAQVAVLLGAALVIAGYRLGCSLVRPVARSVGATDFSNLAVLGIGLSCWVLGSAALAYYAIVVTPVNSMQATQQGLANMGPLLTFAVMLGYLIQPLGVVILAYGYAKNRAPFWFGLVLALVFLQLVLGFITDTKGTALTGILLLAITQTLWDNKLSKGWVAGVFVFAILVFPVMQAARIERGARGLDRAHAFEQFTQVLARAWESREKVNEGAPHQRAQTFLERSSGEAMLEPIFEHAGVDTPLLNGRTLVALPYAFIPRLLLPDKEDVPVGQLYNHVFLHAASDDFTYISFSQLGEFYWNFGWPGVIFGCLLTGLLLGYIGAKSCLSEVHSLTRLLIMLITIKMLCFGFGGSIALVYIVWMRAMAAIGLMHLVFARPTGISASEVVPGRGSGVGSAVGDAVGAGAMGVSPVGARPAGPLFPNLMR